MTQYEITARFDALGDQIHERIQSEEYLDLVRRAFRAWDRADTDEKRRYVANLIANASGTSLCSDDVVRLFIDWLDAYHEAHFAVIREIYKKPGCTRHDVWSSRFSRASSSLASRWFTVVKMPPPPTAPRGCCGHQTHGGHLLVQSSAGVLLVARFVMRGVGPRSGGVALGSMPQVPEKVPEPGA